MPRIKSSKPAASPEPASQNDKTSQHSKKQPKLSGDPPKSSRKQLKLSKNQQIILLSLALIVVVVGTIFFVAAAGESFGKLGALEQLESGTSDFSDDGEALPDFYEITAEDYETMVKGRKSFVVLIGQASCKSIDILKEFLKPYMLEYGFSVYELNFSDLKQTSLYEKVKYYPSMAIIKRGIVSSWLRADSDEDALKYGDASAFGVWLEEYL